MRRLVYGEKAPGCLPKSLQTYLLLLISMLWHRQAIFKSKGDKLCSSAECRIGTRGCCYFRCSGTGKRYSNRKETSCVPLLNAGFEPGVVVNFDALAQASDIQIERRQVVFLCWMQDLNPGLLLISMLWHRQAIFKSKGDKLCSSAECRIWTRGCC